ncbi:hypothetical protein [Kingella denitrificans]|jgi:hypothetical protein|nr:MAG: hypothetical protein D8B47_00740 [Kingella sp. (in: b-proteobacteria)]
MKDYLLISLIIFFSSLWGYSHIWNFSIWDEPTFIKIKHIQIVERINVTVQHEKYGNYLVLDIRDRKAKAECNGISFQSPEYDEICKLQVGTKIQAANVQFLDFNSPRLDGMLLWGEFIFSNKVINFDISKKQDAITYFLWYRRMQIWLIHMIIIASFCFSLYFFISMLRSYKNG